MSAKCSVPEFKGIFDDSHKLPACPNSSAAEEAITAGEMAYRNFVKERDRT